MADTKRDYLYDFNSKLRDICSVDSSIVSVFENIDNENLNLSPDEIANYDFVEKINKCIFMIKKIIVMPYKTVEGKQMIFPVSKAEKVNRDSVKLTIADKSLWTISEGRRVPKLAYSLTNEDVCKNYENAFILQFINALVNRLKKIRADFSKTRGIGLQGVDVSRENMEFYKLVTSQINKLSRLSKEQVFAENANISVDLSNIYLTDTIKSDKRYNFCYRFYCMEFKGNKKRTTVTTDFRVLYHNFALTQVLYNLYKDGYTIDDRDKFQISVSGKAFINSIEFKKADKTVIVSRAKNGVDLVSGEKSCHIEFAKSFINDTVEINDDCRKRLEKYNSNGKGGDVFIAYLSSDINLCDEALSFGYKSVDMAMRKVLGVI